MAHVIKTHHNSTPKSAEEPQAGDGMQPEPLTVRIPVALRMTGIGRSKLYQLIQSRDIEIVKIGAVTLIPVDSLRRLAMADSVAP